MSRTSRFAAVVALLGVVLVSVSTVILINRELTRLRARIETALSTALGRAVSIEGDLTVGLAFATEVVAEGLRIGNPDWASRDYLAYADRAEVQFELVPLLRDRLFIVSNLELEGADVRLERSEDGFDNWTISGRQQQGAQLPQVHKLSIQNSTLVLALADAPERQFRVDAFEATRTDRAGIELSAAGAFDAVTFEFEAIGGRFDEPSQPGTWPFELFLNVDGHRADLKGELVEPFGIRGSSFELSVVGGDTGWLERLLHPTSRPMRYELSSTVLLTQSGFSLSGARGYVAGLGPAEELVLTSGDLLFDGGALDLTSSGTLDGMPFEVSFRAPEVPLPTAVTGVALRARLGNTEFDISGNGAWADGAVDLDVDLAVATPRTDDLLDLLGVALPSPGPFHASARLTAAGGNFNFTELTARLGDSQLEGELSLDTTPRRPTLTGRLSSRQIDLSDFGANTQSVPRSRTLPDITLPTDWLTALDAELEVGVQTLLGMDVAVTNISLAASLRRGRLTIEPLSASISGVNLRGAASLSGGASTDIELALQTEELRPDDVLRQFDLPEVLSGVLGDLDLRLSTTGDSLLVMLARADLSLSIGSGEVEVSYDRDKDPIQLHVDGAKATSAPGRPVGLALSGDVGTRPFDLALYGGQLSSLIRDTESWPALNLELNTRLMGAPGTLSASVRPVAALWNRGNATIEVTGALAGINAESSAVISLPGDVIGTPLNVRLWSDDTAEAIALMGLNPALETSFEASGIVEFADGLINVTNVDGSTPYREMTSGEFVVALSEPARVTGELDLDILDLDRLTIDLMEGAGNGEPIQGRLLSERTLPLHLLNAIEIDSTLRIRQLRVFGITLRDVTVSSLIEQGILNWHAATNDGSVVASIHIDPRGAVPQMMLDTQWRDYRARRADSQTEVSSTIPAVGLDLKLNGQGESIAEFFGSAGGEIRLWVGPERLRIAREGFLGRNLVLQVLDTLRPASRAARQTELICAAAYFEVEDGIASSTRGVAIQTRDLNVVGGGAINFGTEELTARFRFRPRRGLGLNVAGMAAPSVSVDGTLLNYSVRLNKGTSIAAGGAAWASGGMSLLYTGLLQRIFSARRPCERVLPELAHD